MKVSLFYKHVTVLDYAYLDHHLGLVGDALIVDMELVGDLDKEGVVFDFSYAKKKVKEIIDRDCDHRLCIPRNLMTADGNDNIALSFKYGQAEEVLHYTSPREGVCEIPSDYVTKDSIKTYLENTIIDELPKNIVSVKLTLREEELPEDKPTFHYTHGLKEHYGNCQRLFHGHRNTVDVFVNGKRREDFEQWLAKDLFKNNVHFCKWENVVNKSEVEKITGQNPSGRFDELPMVEIEYTSAQGTFNGKLPGRAVYFLDTETTVELLSIHFAKLVKEKVGESDIVTVHAYEGIAKGSTTTL
jgi:6-pyruvoyl-tetrahydropterin synthase